MPLLRACLGCGEPTPGSRCPACQAVENARRGSAHARGYGRQWERRAAAVRREQPACQVCGSTADLTVDHITPKAAGGTDERDNLRTLCRRHNSAKGARS